jgi:hypothetical protein
MEPPKISGKLYSPGSVTIATLLGSPLAGAIVMALNYDRMGQRKTAWQCCALGFVGTVALFALGIIFPKLPNGAAVGSVVGMYYAAKSAQGPQFQQHIQQGGRADSPWKAAGIGLLCLVVIGFFIVAFAALFPKVMHE